MTTLGEERLRATARVDEERAAEQKPSVKNKEKFKELYSKKEDDEPKEGLSGLFSIIPRPQDHEPNPTTPEIAPLRSLNPVAIAPPAATASPQVEVIFEQIVSTMILIHHEGVSETTFTLNAPAFASSPFYGAQITVIEYATAPKTFNVSLKASAEAIQVAQAHIGSLFQTIESGRFEFSLHRIEMEIGDKDRPVFHRKEAPKDPNEGER